MTKADLIEEVSRVVEMTRKESEVIVEAIFDSIVRSLRGGDKIEIRGFGSFRTRQRQPRIGRNPKTGARVEVPAKKIPYFKPSKELKDVVNNSATPAGSRRRRRRPNRCPTRKRAWIISGRPGGISMSPRPGNTGECVFCAAARGSDDKGRLVVFRATHNFIILNRFPYTCGHIMVVPYAHVDTISALEDEALVELIRLTRESEQRSARGLPAGWVEYRDEPRQERRRRGGGPYSYAYSAALDRRRKLRHDGGGEPRAAGIARSDLGKAQAIVSGPAVTGDQVRREPG